MSMRRRYGGNEGSVGWAGTHTRDGIFPDLRCQLRIRSIMIVHSRTAFEFAKNKKDFFPFSHRPTPREQGRAGCRRVSSENDPRIKKFKLPSLFFHRVISRMFLAPN